MDDPDQFMNRYIAGASANYGRFSDPAARRPVLPAGPGARPGERKKLVIEMQKRVLEQAYYMPGLWWTRRVVHLAKVKNYVAPPSHYTNQKLEDVWLSRTELGARTRSRRSRDPSTVQPPT